jgi:hypothetical protein
MQVALGVGKHPPAQCSQPRRVVWYGSGDLAQRAALVRGRLVRIVEGADKACEQSRYRGQVQVSARTRGRFAGADAWGASTCASMARIAQHRAQQDLPRLRRQSSGAKDHGPALEAIRVSPADELYLWRTQSSGRPDLSRYPSQPLTVRFASDRFNSRGVWSICSNRSGRT